MYEHIVVVNLNLNLAASPKKSQEQWTPDCDSVIRLDKCSLENGQGEKVNQKTLKKCFSTYSF